jgi:hypothetical protein
MKYPQRAEVLKDLFFRVNRAESKWKDKDDLHAYLERFGGRLKGNRRRRSGYVVCYLCKYKGETLVAEVPVQFAITALAMGGFP